MGYDASIFGAPPAAGWCEGCAVSRHPGVLVANGDEIEGCDECGVVDSDDDAADRMHRAGCVVELLDDDGNFTALRASREEPRTAYVLVDPAPFYRWTDAGVLEPLPE